MDVLAKGSGAGCEGRARLNGPLLFFARFVFIAGALYGLWQILSPLYISLVMSAANELFSGLELPVQLQRFGHSLVFAYQRTSGIMLRLEAHQYEAIYLNTIAAIALLGATPKQSLEWKFRWVCKILPFLWATHVATFFMGGYIAIWDYAHSIPPSQSQGELIVEFSAYFPFEHKLWCTALLGQWNIWGRYAVVVGGWFFALRRELVGQTIDFLQQQIGVPTREVHQLHNKSLIKKGVVPKYIRAQRPRQNTPVQ